MTALISAAEAPGIRAALNLFLVHSFTRTPVTAGAEDAHGNETTTNGAPVTGLACKYISDDRVRIDETGVVLIGIPTVTVAHDSPLVVGDLVSNVTDSEGTVLLVGPARVEIALPSAGLGPTLKKRFTLRGADVPRVL